MITRHERPLRVNWTSLRARKRTSTPCFFLHVFTQIRPQSLSRPSVSLQLSFAGTWALRQQMHRTWSIKLTMPTSGSAWQTRPVKLLKRLFFKLCKALTLLTRLWSIRFAMSLLKCRVPWSQNKTIVSGRTYLTCFLRSFKARTRRRLTPLLWSSTDCLVTSWTTW